MSVEEPVHSVLDSVHDFWHSSRIESIPLNFAFEDVEGKLAMNEAERRGSNDEIEVFGDGEAPLLGKCKSFSKIPLLRYDVHIHFVDRRAFGVDVPRAGAVFHPHVELRSQKLIRIILTLVRLVAQILHVVVVVSGALTANDLVPRHRNAADTELALLKVLERYSRIVHEVPRTHVVDFVSLVANQLLCNLEHTDASTLGIGLFDDLSVLENLLTPIMSQDAATILPGVVEPNVVGSGGVADLDLIRNQGLHRLHLHLALAVSSGELVDGTSRKEHRRPVRVGRH